LRIAGRDNTVAENVLRSYLQRIESSVANRAFDQIVTAEGMPFLIARETLARCYRKDSQTVEAPMHYTRGIRLEFWRPLPAGCSPE
jgi:hypothetical protein